MAQAAPSSPSPKSDLKWRVSDVTRCPICLEDVKNPKALLCLHSFCLQCLQEYWKDTSPGDGVLCPVCRKVLAIPVEGLEALPHNFFVQILIDVKEASKEQSGDVLCEACEEDSEDIGGNISPATMYCVDCNQKLCKPCSRPHRAMRGGPHQVKELGAELIVELIQQRGCYCDRHAGKRLELYCFDCELNVCMKCFAVEHTQHKCMEVEKVAEDFSRSSETDVERLLLRSREFCNAAAQADAQDKELIKAVQDGGRLIRQRGETVKNMIDKQIESLLTELETFKKTNQKELASRKEGLQLGLTAMESLTAYSTELLSKGSPCDVTRTAHNLHARADELLKAYVTPADYCAPDVKFVPMNIDELTGPNGEQNLIGRVFTSNAAGIRVVKKLPDFDWCNRVIGLTCLDDELFILRNRYRDDEYSADEEEDQHYQVEVYSTKSSNYTGLREFSESGRGADIISCEQRRCLYISNRDKNCVQKLALSGDIIAKWRVPGVYGLSLTPTNNLLVTCPHSGKLVELCSESGECVRQLEPQSCIKEPWHAVQLASQHYVVSHSFNEQSRVAVVDLGGNVSRTCLVSPIMTSNYYLSVRVT